MPDLMNSLQGQDLGHFRILAEHWGLELDAPDARNALHQLVPNILHKGLIEDVVGTLPVEARRALDDLASGGGRLAWVRFTQRYGEVRQWGAGRRDRERPDQHPISIAERLWYLALVGRANLDTPDGPVEFAYIPEDILHLLPSRMGGSGPVLGRTASPQESAIQIPACDHILDDGCTLLAALRCELSPVNDISVPSAFLTTLLIEAHVLDDENTLNSDETRHFLEMPRGDALRHLVQIWLHGAINDLRMLPSLSAEGDWENYPARTRQIILEYLLALKEDRWWNLTEFILAIQRNQPDFQRPTGDYDTWYLRDTRTGEFLRGFEHWDDVEGALLRYLITGPLHWLGILDLAAPAQGMPVSAFRFGLWGHALVQDDSPTGVADEDQPIHVYMDGRIVIPRLARRAIRYQLARFSTWEGYKQEDYHYRLTPSALERAGRQGLTVNHLLTLLNNQTLAVPPMLEKALHRWEKQGTEVRVEALEILRSASPDILHNLRKSPAGRYFGDALGVNSVIVKPGAGRQVLAALADMGILGEVREKPANTEDDSNGSFQI
jgi:hypothetical protein